MKFIKTSTHYHLAILIVAKEGHLRDFSKVANDLNTTEKVIEAVAYKWYCMDGGATTTKEKDEYHFSSKFINKLLEESKSNFSNFLTK